MTESCDTRTKPNSALRSIPRDFSAGHLLRQSSTDEEVCPGPTCTLQEIEYWPDTFCTGHVQLRSGRVMLGGGNVTGRGTGGGLFDRVWIST